MNKVILMGRLTRDPEVRYTQTNNTLVASFSLAVNRRFTREGDGVKNVEFCSKYFKKGQQVAVIGRIQTRTWEDQSGQKRYTTEVIAEETYFADSKRDSNASANGFDNTFGGDNGTSSGDTSDFEVSSGDDLPF